jgi:hypothetical protein
MQLSDRSVVEHTRLGDRALAEHVVGPLGGAWPEERLRVRGAIGLLGACEYLPRHEAGARALQDVLLVEHAELEGRGQAVGELDHARIEEREPALDGARHRHPIALSREQVRAEQRADLEPLVLRER